MQFLYDQGRPAEEARQEHTTFLLGNGLGGYCSVSAFGSVTRGDQGILVAAVRAPNQRVTLVHRLRETLSGPWGEAVLSSQRFADGTPPEAGQVFLRRFQVEGLPEWQYEAHGVSLRRRCAMQYRKNCTAVEYDLVNSTDEDCLYRVCPLLKFAPKEVPRETRCAVAFDGHKAEAEGWQLYVSTDGQIKKSRPRWESLAYQDDEKDGREPSGLSVCCFAVEMALPAHTSVTYSIVFSAEETPAFARDILEGAARRCRWLQADCGLDDPTARQLALAADAFIVDRASTGGRTILAGYPFFSDWGRDTMIALRGCCLSTGRCEDAKSILRTFLAYERGGLVPNLFPEGEEEPLYNTADAALLLIDGVWRYYRRTGDRALVQEAWPVMQRIVRSYEAGTGYAIGMDEDGLIHAGEGLAQVTWMDVRIQNILPTPRHGKPVEINAYWYNALCIMAALSGELGHPEPHYTALARRVKESFVRKFYIPGAGYLRDVLSGTAADTQIRCNQIWALSMPFTMLSPQQERAVLDTVYRHLYTPYGLRSLSPQDPEYHPVYGGPQLCRDLAYHQGTTWVFPLGAYYLAYLKVQGRTPEAAAQVKRQLQAVAGMLYEGCAGQLPEVYDGTVPQDGKGCFAQAWSVGELLTVYEEIQRIERTVGGTSREHTAG